MAAAAAGAGLGGGGARAAGGGGAGRAIWGGGLGGVGGGGGVGLATCGGGVGLAACGGGVGLAACGGGVGLAACGGGPAGRSSGLGGGGGGGAGVARFFLCVDSGTAGFALGVAAGTPVLRSLIPGVSAPGVFGTPAVAGVFGVETAGDVAVAGPNFALGFAVLGAVPDGKGGAPFWPGTGKALALGKASGVTFVGNGLVDDAPPPAPLGVVTLTAGLIDALGGTGSFPCWISEALCATAGGRPGVAAVGGVPPAPGTPLAAPAPGPAGPGCGRWLITLLMTVVLWMLAKMMLFGGGAT